jgi:regulator of protease activity HflC (stomatin/prohibitin superfamily)
MGWKCITASLLIGAGLIIMIVLLALAVQNVAQDEWGIEYNKISRKLYTDVKGPGRYVIDPASTFYKFKNTFVPWDLIIDCWTSDIIEVTLDVAVQTLYIHEELPQVMFEFGDEDAFLPYVENVLKRTLRASCSNYSALQYYTSRGAVQADMLYRIENELPLLGTHITTGGYLQLRNIKLPDDFNRAVIAKQTAQQEILLALNQRDQSITIADTTLSQAVNNATSIINNATLHAQAIIFDAQQRSQGINSTYANRLAVYRTAMTLLGMNASEYIRSVLQTKLIADNRHSKVFL